MAVKSITGGSSGPRIKKLQKGVKKTLEGHGFDRWAKGVIVDGKPGPMTFKMSKLAGSMQGLSQAQLRNIGNGRITRHAELILTHEKERSPAMKQRSKKRDEHFDKIRHELKHPPDDPDGYATFEGETVAAWMVGRGPGPNGTRVNWLQKIRDTGIWGGVIVSGARTAAYSESLCYGMCGAPSCPGTCAGRSSNHVPVVYPGGALDVSDYYNFGRAARQVGAPLRNDLPADRVHYSVSGH